MIIEKSERIVQNVQKEESLSAELWFSINSSNSNALANISALLPDI